MTRIAASLQRTSTLLPSQFLLSNLNRTQIEIARVQNQLSTGKLVNKFSDDAVRASSVTFLEQRLERSEQHLLNLSASRATISTLDQALGDASELILEAKSIASSQIGVTSDSTTRETQAVVIDAMIERLFQLSNREINGVHVFGGSTPTRTPVERVNGGFRYVGRGEAFLTDVGGAEQIPAAIGGSNAIGEVSSRQQSTIDLNPGLDPETPVEALLGARGVGVTLGEIEFQLDTLPMVRVDVSQAESVQDLADIIESAIRAEETAQGVTRLGAGGVSVNGSGLQFDVVAGGPPTPSITFAEVGEGKTATDLGLMGGTFDSGNQTGQDVNPRLTGQTSLSSIASITTPLDSVRFRFTDSTGSRVTLVDLSGAQNIDDVINTIQANVPGVRVRINPLGTGLDVFNEISGPALSIEDVAGGGADTATELGIKTFSSGTPLSVLNNGRGVEIVTGRTDPVTGLVDPALNVDFVVTLGNGDSFTVDLRPQDLATVQTVVDRINAEASGAELSGDIPAGSFNALVSPESSGLVFEDLGGLGVMGVQGRNNSPAARDLGLADAVYDGSSARLTGSDRAGVRVDNLFTALMDLRDALRSNSSLGITLAGESLESQVDRVSSTRAVVGVYANRVERVTRLQEDRNVLESQIKSQLQDLDFAEASTRFTLLQTQLQGALSSGAASQSLSLLDFVG